MACEKLYIWIVKRMKIQMNGLHLFSLARDRGIRDNALRGVHYQELMDFAEATVKSKPPCRPLIPDNGQTPRRALSLTYCTVCD
jgi:hypothetical protein